jgi:hypothetical protein
VQQVLARYDGPGTSDVYAPFDFPFPNENQRLVMTKPTLAGSMVKL